MLDIVATPIQEEQMQYEAVGTHLLLTLRGCAISVLNDEVQLRELAKQAAESTGATVRQVLSHRFSPHGITVLIVLAESHASLHTYPESGVVFWDCFTCGSVCKPNLSVPVLVEALQPVTFTEELVSRG